MNIRNGVIGMGSALPEERVSSASLEARYGLEAGWIFSRTGIAERRVAGDGVHTLTLALEASRNALSTAGLEAKDLDLIIAATVTPSQPLPATAAQLQHALGARPIPAFDIAAACSGFIHACAAASAMLDSGYGRRALVVGADLISRIVNWEDHKSSILFADGAGAAIIGPVEEPRGFHGFVLGTRGDLSALIQIPGGGTAEPLNAGGLAAHRGKVRMNGQEVFKQSLLLFSATAQEVLEKTGLTWDRVDWFLPHQANRRIMDGVAQRLGLPARKLISNIETRGNTSSASIPIALDEAIRGGIVKQGETLVSVSMGAGVAYGGFALTI
ncbi:MAG: 3-oxoacyl-[acyl-carrier-protein] synthase 3 protein 1 [Myxococcota bacterium]|nr:3-oxoacyl-[acyl-carrier-protein] synthase 3 protein 1 [Myxococcota bacterium]